VTQPDEPSPGESAPPHTSGIADLLAQLRPLLLGVTVLTILTGAVFPLVLGLLARLFFPYQSRGSLVTEQRVVLGSDLIGQGFSHPGYFHPRPSAAGGGYDALASGGTNLGPANPKLREDVRKRAEKYRRVNELSADDSIPIDAVTSSGSGLDPHISPANAMLQVHRVAQKRGMDDETVRRLVLDHTEGRQLGFLGEPRVNVLTLNRALDHAAPLP
jgi:potassium-transporting ATPase KdpC subunit